MFNPINRSQFRFCYVKLLRKTMSNQALEEWSRILVVFGNERLLSVQTVVLARVGWFATKRASSVCLPTAPGACPL